MKTLTSYCLCGKPGACDGWTNPLKYEPLQLGFNFFGDKESHGDDDIKEAILKDCGRNVANVVWDGVPVFFNNLEGIRRTGTFGELMGGSLANVAEEANYYINSGKNSSGMNSIGMLANVVNKMGNAPTVKKLLETGEYIEKMGVNDVWKKTYEKNYKYYVKQVKPVDKEIPTLLFDEIDKTFDIINTYELFKNFLPAIQKKLGCQIIIVSHSPIVLSDIVLENNDYNLISLDDKYTEKCIETLRNIAF